MSEKEFYNTREVADIYCVQPDTVRRSYCINGHYHQLVPEKRPNGRLCWPGNKVRASIEKETTS